jgi:histone-lysine N-methyltransferase SETD3
MQVAQLIKECRYEQAIEFYRNSSANEKDFANMSMVYMLMNDADNALVAAQKAIAIAPNWAKGYYRAAKAYELKLDAENAKAMYAKMKEYAPDMAIGDAANVHVNILRNWLIREGAVLNSVTVDYYAENYRGMRVTKDTPFKSPIMQIPRHCIVSLLDSEQTGYLRNVSKSITSPHARLALELLDSKKTGRRTEYLNTVPDKFTSLPNNFSADEMHELRGSYIMVKVAEIEKYLHNEYNSILQYINADFTYDEYVWARNVVVTRVYYVRRMIDGKPYDDLVLVPMADMANHTLNQNTFWYYDSKKEVFTVEANTFILANDNLYETYGAKSNYRFLLNYGFVVDDNHEDQVHLVLDPVLQSYLSSYSDVSDHLNKFFGTQDVFLISYDVNDAAFQNVIKNIAAKVARIQEGEERSLLTDIYQLLKTFISRQLDGYPTTLEEDQAILDMYDQDFNTRNCIILRMGEKKILHRALNFLDDMIEVDAKKDTKLLKKIIAKYKVSKKTSMLSKSNDSAIKSAEWV